MFLDWRGRPWAVIGQRSPDREEAPQLRLRHHPRLCTCWAWLMISGQGEDETPPLPPKPGPSGLLPAPNQRQTDQAQAHQGPA